MKLLIICNYQVDYVDGSLGFPKAKEIEDLIIESLKDYDDFLFLLDSFDDDFINSYNYKMLPVKRCIKGTLGIEVYGKLKDYLDKAKAVIYKDDYASLDLIKFLKDNPSYEEIDLCGISSHQSVFVNAIIAKSTCPNSLVVLKKNLTRSFDTSLEAKAYNILNSLLIEVK